VHQSTTGDQCRKSAEEKNREDDQIRVGQMIRAKQNMQAEQRIIAGKNIGFRRVM
jgi:hypothetical protein